MHCTLQPWGMVARSLRWVHTRVPTAQRMQGPAPQPQPYPHPQARHCAQSAALFPCPKETRTYSCCVGIQVRGCTAYLRRCSKRGLGRLDSRIHAQGGSQLFAVHYSAPAGAVRQRCRGSTARARCGSRHRSNRPRTGGCRCSPDVHAHACADAHAGAVVADVDMDGITAGADGAAAGANDGKAAEKAKEAHAAHAGDAAHSYDGAVHGAAPQDAGLVRAAPLHC